MKRSRWWVWWCFLPGLIGAQPVSPQGAKPLVAVVEQPSDSLGEEARLPSFVLYENNQVLVRISASASGRASYVTGSLTPEERERFDAEWLPVLEVDELAENYTVSSQPSAGDVLVYLGLRSAGAVVRIVGLGRIGASGRIPNYGAVAESGLPEPIFNLLHHLSRIRPVDASPWKPTELTLWLTSEPKATQDRCVAWPNEWPAPSRLGNVRVSRISTGAYALSGRKTLPTPSEPLWLWADGAGWSATVSPAAPQESVWLEGFAAADERRRLVERASKTEERPEVPVGRPDSAAGSTPAKLVELPGPAPSALEVPVVPLTLPGSVPTP